MPQSILNEIARLRRMDVAGLRAEWERVFGAPPRSTNRQHMWRKLSWELQARVHGGLSTDARDRLDQLGQKAFDLATSRNVCAQVANAAPAKPNVTRIRDPRRPTPGSVLTRQYHDQEIRVVALEDGFEYDGRVYGSLSAVARAITGQKWNGFLFFGLTERKRRR